MGYSVLDAIRKKELISATETVNADWSSPSVSLDDREGEWSISLNYDSGVGADMRVFVQLSNDNVIFADLTDSEVAITDADGMILFDMDGSGALYARISIVVSAGSIDVTNVFYAAKQRH